MTEEGKEKIDVVEMKCPNCGSTELNMPENIEKREDGFFIKGSDLQLHTLPMIPYVCSKCGRRITSDELFDYLSRHGPQLAVG